MNSADGHPENSYSGQDTLAWDQIRPVFAYTDQQETEQPLPNEPVSSSAPTVRDDFVHSDRLSIETTPVKKEPRNEIVRSNGPRSDVILQQHVLRPDLVPMRSFAVPTWPLVERIGILGLLIVAVASVTVLLVSYEQSLYDIPLPPSPSLALRSGPLPSAQASTIASANDRVATAAGLTPVAAPGEIPTENRPPQRRASIPPEDPELKAENTLRSPAIEPMSSNSPAPDTLPPTTAGRSAVSAPAAAPPTKPAIGLANEEMSRLIMRGQDFLNQGDFAAARLLFERAADGGSAEAAMALGSTYDPAVIKKLGAVAVTPDVERALKWYATAADRGSSDAAERYANLIQAR